VPIYDVVVSCLVGRDDGPIPSNAVTMPLDRFAAQDKLSVEPRTTAFTRYPNDPRADTTRGTFAYRRRQINRLSY
jgi:hypothetical protein